VYGDQRRPRGSGLTLRYLLDISGMVVKGFIKSEDKRVS